jgi:hypothetical protein
MSAQIIVLPGEDESLFGVLLSDRTLPRHAHTRWDLDAPDLPDEPEGVGLRSLHWHSAICLTALDWLHVSGPDNPEQNLIPVLEDLLDSLRGGSAALTKHGGHIQFVASEIQMAGNSYPSTAHAVVNLACRCVDRARSFVGTPETPDHIASCWNKVHDRFAPEWANGAFHPSGLAVAMARELRIVAASISGIKDAQSTSPLVSDTRPLTQPRPELGLHSACPVRLQGQGKPILVCGDVLKTRTGQPYIPTPALYRTLEALVADFERGGPGLTRDELNRAARSPGEDGEDKSGDRRRALQNLAKQCPEWKGVFVTAMKGKKRVEARYCLAWPC